MYFQTGLNNISPNIAAQFMTGQPARPASLTVNLTPQERGYYSNMFGIADVQGNQKITGGEAVEFFIKSGLPKEQLREIWAIATPNNEPYLDRERFYVALRLIALAQEGKSVSPESIIQNVPASLPNFRLNDPRAGGQQSAQLSQWNIPDQIKSDLYNKFSMASKGTGFVAGLDAKGIFQQQCNLDLQQLKQIWDMVDTRKQGKLTRGQFVAAMFILHNVNRGIPIPGQLPQPLEEYVNEEASTGLDSQFGGFSIPVASPPKFQDNQFDFGVSSELTRPPQAQTRELRPTSMQPTFENNLFGAQIEANPPARQSTDFKFNLQEDDMFGLNPAPVKVQEPVMQPKPADKVFRQGRDSLGGRSFEGRSFEGRASISSSDDHQFEQQLKQKQEIIDKHQAELERAKEKRRRLERMYESEIAQLKRDMQTLEKEKIELANRKLPEPVPVTHNVGVPKEELAKQKQQTLSTVKSQLQVVNHAIDEFKKSNQELEISIQNTEKAIKMTKDNWESVIQYLEQKRQEAIKQMEQYMQMQQAQIKMQQVPQQMPQQMPQEPKKPAKLKPTLDDEDYVRPPKALYNDEPERNPIINQTENHQKKHKNISQPIPPEIKAPPSDPVPFSLPSNPKPSSSILDDPFAEIDSSQASGFSLDFNKSAKSDPFASSSSQENKSGDIFSFEAKAATNQSGFSFDFHQ